MALVGLPWHQSWFCLFFLLNWLDIPPLSSVAPFLSLFNKSTSGLPLKCPYLSFVCIPVHFLMPMLVSCNIFRILRWHVQKRLLGINYATISGSNLNKFGDHFGLIPETPCMHFSWVSVCILILNGSSKNWDRISLIGASVHSHSIGIFPKVCHVIKAIHTSLEIIFVYAGIDHRPFACQNCHRFLTFYFRAVVTRSLLVRF